MQKNKELYLAELREKLIAEVDTLIDRVGKEMHESRVIPGMVSFNHFDRNGTLHHSIFGFGSISIHSTGYVYKTGTTQTPFRFVHTFEKHSRGMFIMIDNTKPTEEDRKKCRLHAEEVRRQNAK